MTALTDAGGNVVQKYAYDPWGARRNPDDWTQKDSRTSWITNRGYTGHEHLDAFGVIDMNGRVYDPLTAQFLSPDPYVQAPDFSQNFNRYSYCLNNPLKFTDESGELFFLWPIVNAFKDLAINTYWKSWKQGINAWTNKENWHSTVMAWKIDVGLFKGNFVQYLSRITWELPQNILGNEISQLHNYFNGVKAVTYYGGATAVTSYSEKRLFGLGLFRSTNGFTLGSYINGTSELTADPGNVIFQHEYGHYLQSQSVGPGYLLLYAIPSAFTKDKYNFAEQDANARAFSYFSKHVEGYNWVDEYGVEESQWKRERNPIKSYNWSLPFDDPDNQKTLKNKKRTLGWII